LIELGLLERETRKEGKQILSNIYTVRDLPESWGGSAPDALGVVHLMHQGSAPDAHKGIPNEGIPSQGKESSPKAASASPSQKVIAEEEEDLEPIIPAPENGNGQSLHVKVRLAFEELHGEQFTNYKKEGPAIKKMIGNSERLYPGKDPETVILFMAKFLKWLKENRRERYWRDVVVSPSMLLCRWDQVYDIARTQHKEAESWKNMKGALS